MFSISIYTELVDCEKLFKMGEKSTGNRMRKVENSKMFLRRKTCFFKKFSTYFHLRLKKAQKNFCFWYYMVLIFPRIYDYLFIINV